MLRYRLAHVSDDLTTSAHTFRAIATSIEPPARDRQPAMGSIPDHDGDRLHHPFGTNRDVRSLFEMAVSTWGNRLISSTSYRAE